MKSLVFTLFLIFFPAATAFAAEDICNSTIKAITMAVSESQNINSEEIKGISLSDKEHGDNRHNWETILQALFQQLKNQCPDQFSEQFSDQLSYQFSDQRQAHSVGSKMW